MRLGKSTAIYSFFSLISKVSGYIRDLFLAAFIGTSVISDIFFIALRLPMLFRVSFSEETFNSAYIPTFGKLQDLSEKEKQYELARKILQWEPLVYRYDGLKKTIDYFSTKI